MYIYIYITSVSRLTHLKDRLLRLIRGKLPSDASQARTNKKLLDLG